MSRTLHFEQITDSRFMDREECLTVINERIEKLKELLNVEGVSVSVSEPRLLEWGNKEDENKIPEYRTKKPKYDTDYYHIQYRSSFRVSKSTRKITWNDIYGIINNVKAVPYEFI